MSKGGALLLVSLSIKKPPKKGERRGCELCTTSSSSFHNLQWCNQKDTLLKPPLWALDQVMWGGTNITTFLATKEYKRKQRHTYLKLYREWSSNCNLALSPLRLATPKVHEKCVWKTSKTIWHETQFMPNFLEILSLGHQSCAL
jgi:hypothetical protein